MDLIRCSDSFWYKNNDDFIRFDIRNLKELFYRLASTYNDKFVPDKNKNKPYIKIYGNPTFQAFIEMIVEKRERVCPTYSSCHYDVHWLPYIAKCGYCDFPFKIIVKKETFDQDQKFIGKLAGLEFSSQSKLKDDRRHFLKSSSS